MAIVRCEQCGKPAAQRVKTSAYGTSPYKPIGHPNSGVVCGKPSCEKPGLVWLKTDEEQEYASGKRIFGIHTQTAKVRVQ